MGHKKIEPSDLAAREARRLQLSQHPEAIVDLLDAANFFNVAPSTYKLLMKQGRAPTGFLMGRRRKFKMRKLIDFPE